MTLTADQFDFIHRMVDEQAGIGLEPDQQIFVGNRLRSVAQRHGWNHLEPLIDGLRNQHDRRLAQEVIESLVTHETSFFRDAHYFDQIFEHILPQLIKLRAAERRLKIWCAACSTGQEAYSVAMILRERFAEQLRDWNVDLLATDLSSIALRQAQSGRYSEVEVRRGLSDERLAQHFQRESTGWRIDDRLKQMVRFHQCNLMETWPLSSGLDLVLLRNVMIYMIPSTRQKILVRMQKAIHPKGYLMLGGTETASIPNLQIACVRTS